MSETLTPVQRLMAAMDRCAIARGEAMWTNGYRAARGLTLTAHEATRLWEKEQAQWKDVERAEASFKRLAQRLTRGAK